jgi:hypothetical protein
MQLESLMALYNPDFWAVHSLELMLPDPSTAIASCMVGGGGCALTGGLVTDNAIMANVSTLNRENIILFTVLLLTRF